MAALPILINGVSYAWVNIKVILFGIPLVGITKISYNEKQEKVNNYGAGAYPVSRGYGAIEYEGSLEIYAEELKRLIDASPKRRLLDIPPFDIQVVFGGKGVQASKDVLRSVEFTENPLDASQGDTKILVTVPLIIGAIER